MKHLGDLTKLKGDSVPLVDVITGGSPCQNLSFAGNRKGLEGNESRLFLEQIRLVKEMRDASKRMGEVRIRPRYLVWENVKGAFSCSNGEDFRRVLEEIARVEDPDAVVPGPPQGRWTSSGCIVGDGWSIAWRLHDAQFWGVPQRRKRIALIADFGGQTAPEILFERESLQGDSESGGQKGEDTAAVLEGSVGTSSRSIAVDIHNGRIDGDKTCTLTCHSELSDHHMGPRVLETKPVDFRTADNAEVKFTDVFSTVRAAAGKGGENAPMVYEERSALSLDRAAFNQGKNALFDFAIDEEVSAPLVARGPNAVLDCGNPMRE